MIGLGCGMGIPGRVLLQSIQLNPPTSVVAFSPTINTITVTWSDASLVPINYRIDFFNLSNGISEAIHFVSSGSFPDTFISATFGDNYEVRIQNLGNGSQYLSSTTAISNAITCS